MLPKSTKVFIVCAILWEIAVAIIYGLFIRYDQDTFTSMNSPKLQYQWSTSPYTSATVFANSTQLPFPYIVVAIAIALLIVGKSQSMQGSL